MGTGVLIGILVLHVAERVVVTGNRVTFKLRIETIEN